MRRLAQFFFPLPFGWHVLSCFRAAPVFGYEAAKISLLYIRETAEDELRETLDNNNYNISLSGLICFTTEQGGHMLDGGETLLGFLFYFLPALVTSFVAVLACLRRCFFFFFGLIPQPSCIIITTTTITADDD